MLQPRAAFRQLSKAASTAASDSLLPHTGCSLRSGCAMDERHGAGTHSRDTARAGAGCQAHLGEPNRWEARRRRSSPPPRAHLAIIRGVGDAAASSLTCGTHCSSVRSSPSCRPATLHGAPSGRTSGVYRNTDLTQIARKRQICATYHRTLPIIRGRTSVSAPREQEWG